MMDEVSDADLALLTQGPIDAAGKYEAVVQAKLRKAAPNAANAIIDLALNSENDRIRLDAAKYILDRTLGKIPDANPAGTQAAGWEQIIDSVLVEPSANDRASGQAIQPRRP